MVDTLGLLVVVLVTAASAADRDGGARVLARAKIAMPSGEAVRPRVGGRSNAENWTCADIVISATISALDPQHLHPRSPELGSRGSSTLPPAAD